MFLLNRLLPSSGPQQNNTPPPPAVPPSAMEVSCSPDSPRQRHMRLILTPHPQVYGFPRRPQPPPPTTTTSSTPTSSRPYPCPCHSHSHRSPRFPGGVLILNNPKPVDLEFLNLPAIPASEIPPPDFFEGEGEDEDLLLCARMRLLAAEWWRRGEDGRDAATRAHGEWTDCWRDRFYPDEPPPSPTPPPAPAPGGRDFGVRAARVVAVGFEGGVGVGGGVGTGGVGGGGGGGRGGTAAGTAGRGVWVYRVPRAAPWPTTTTRRTRRRRWRRRRDWGMEEECERRYVRVRAARTMEERCAVIRECGGEYFGSVDAWRAVAEEEHVREGIVPPDRPPFDWVAELRRMRG